MPFFRRSKRSKTARHYSSPPDLGKQESSRKIATPGDVPYSKKHQLRRGRPASTSQVNEPRVNGKTVVQKHISKSVIPDVIASHDNQDSTEVVNTKMNTIIDEPAQPITVSPRNNFTDGKDRSVSFTRSETEAVDTLDNVLRDFDLDDNFTEIPNPDEFTNVEKPDSVRKIEPIYGDSFSVDVPNDGAVENKERALLKRDLADETKASDHLEPVYAIPMKINKPTTPNKNNEQNQRNDSDDEGPEVPPKRFQNEENENNLSEIKKTIPDSFSQSHVKTELADTKDDKFSHKRSPAEESINSFSSERGESSTAVPGLTNEDHKEPLPRYDGVNVNGTLKSITQSTSFSDESTTKDNWTSSLTSSSASGSRKVHKNIRPDVLDLIRSRKKNEQQEDETKTSRQHDHLVKRSFRLIRQASMKKDLPNKTLENDYFAIKNEADEWLANSERLRANSQGKKTDSAETISSSGSPQRTLEPESESWKTKPISEEDKDLVRLMETGIFPENTSKVVNGSQSSSTAYVPRALRMSFGQSWNGIRKDRRAWKSREISSMVNRSPRKGPKNLSTRLDEQDEHLEMLF